VVCQNAAKIGLALPPADQRARAATAEISDLCATGLDRAGAQGGDTATVMVFVARCDYSYAPC
jgi:hypothetical protein